MSMSMSYPYRLGKLLWLVLLPITICCCQGRGRLPTNTQRQTQTVTTSSSYDTINGRPCYRSLEGINQWASDLAAKYPNLVTVETIGQSYNKRDIYALNITASSINSSSNNNINSTLQHQSSSSKGKLLLTSGIHAREYTPTELLARFIDRLIDGYNNHDAQITSILQHTEIHAIIHVNPDGRVMAEKYPNSYWRKNMNPSDGCKNEDFYGVDINRNFDFLWGDKNGASNNPCSDEYHGAAPNSEPETQAVANYANKVFPERQRRSNPEKQMNDPLGDEIMGLYMDIHSTGEFIYYPWGHADKKSPDDDAYQAIARKMSHWNGYDLWAPNYDFLYPVSGDSSDYMYAVMGVASMGLELGFNFYENCDTFEKDVLPSNLDVLLYAASIASMPFSLAKGPDVLDVRVEYNNDDDREIIVTADISDVIMVNSLNGEPDHHTGDQDIVKVVLYLDVHPDDVQDEDELLTWEMSPLDGELDSNEEIVEVSLSTRELSPGRHTLHVQAIDFDGYKGPIKSISIEVFEKEATISPSEYPTSATLPTIASQSPNTATPFTHTTSEPSGNLSAMSPSPNASQSNLTANPSQSPTETLELPKNATTTSPSLSPSQSPTLPPNITSSPTTLSPATNSISSIPSHAPTSGSSSPSTNSTTSNDALLSLQLQ
jgi:carboxypeptidase T